VGDVGLLGEEQPARRCAGEGLGDPESPVDVLEDHPGVLDAAERLAFDTPGDDPVAGGAAGPLFSSSRPGGQFVQLR
jgi:hypothetical protein